ncbi:MAG: sulfite exporter TauE/SafE family protein [Planctomycetaceae bacterium]|nr:sulfite exporter TauE/SafE family protein [Planctomycetaceae bacterium]
MTGFVDIELLLTLIVGGAVGFLSGVFGFGGGFLIVPVLNISLGLPMQIAVGSAACQVLGPATTSVLARRRSWDELRLPLIVFGGLSLGVYLGAEILHKLSTSTPDANMNVGHLNADRLVLSVYLVLLVILGGFALWESSRALKGRPVRTGWIIGWPVPPLTCLPGMGGQRVSVPVLAWFGFVVGFLSGLLGMSGGLLLLPGLIYMLGMDWRESVAASMAIVWLVALQSTIAHAWLGHVRLPIVMALLVGGTLGARLGVHFSRDVAPERGRRSFGWLAMSTAGVISVRLVELMKASGMQ